MATPERREQKATRVKRARGEKQVLQGTRDRPVLRALLVLLVHHNQLRRRSRPRHNNRRLALKAWFEIERSPTISPGFFTVRSSPLARCKRKARV
jgi:hypothetical protein